jgi:hypothetical protein
MHRYRSVLRHTKNITRNESRNNYLSAIIYYFSPPKRTGDNVGIQSVIESRRSNRVSKVFRARARVIKETVIPF